MSTSAPRAQTSGGADTPPEAVLTYLRWLESQYRARPVDIAASPGGAVGASRQVISGGASHLVGWSLAETTGAAAAVIRLRDGKGATDQVLATIRIPSGQCLPFALEHHGLCIETGNLWLEWVSGSVEGVLWVR